MIAEFKAFLEDISVAFTEPDFMLWRNRLILPFSIISRDGPVVMTTEAAVLDNFQNYITASEIMQLDLVARRMISLDDCHDGTWLGTYETRLVSHGQLATAPYTATSLLQLIEGQFRMSSMLNGRGHRDWTGTPDG